MKVKNISTIVVALLSLTINALAAEPGPISIGSVEMLTDAKSQGFEQVREKVGKWEGRMTQGLSGEVFDVSYEFKLTSAGNTVTETIVEDGVEMLTTYSDDKGELVIRHYCALGTEPVFKVKEASEDVVSIELDESRTSLHANHDSFVTAMSWTMTSKDSMTFENTVMLDGELTKNVAELRRVQ